MNVTEEMIEVALRKLQNNHRPISEAGKSVDERALVEEIITAALSVAPQVIDVDALAQEIRRIDGNHDKGAGALAEALMPFLTARIMSELEGVFTGMNTAEKQDTPTTQSKQAALTGMTDEIVNLVIDAREAFDCAFLPEEESRALDKALEPFSSKVRYANEPDAITDTPTPSSHVLPDWETPKARAAINQLAWSLWKEDQPWTTWTADNREHYMIRAAMLTALATEGKDNG